MNTSVFYIVNYFFLGYGLLLLSCYLSSFYFAFRAVHRGQRHEAFMEVLDISKAADVPSVTLVAPAFNEGLTIVSNVKSLLSLQYPHFNLIIVNDGSTDNSLEKLIQTFDLEKKDHRFATQPIPTAEVQGVYVSRKPQYHQLTVIDKDNGGKADAINAGINFATSELVLCTDADCIIEQGALLKMVRPFLEESKREIIGCGAGIGIANDSEIKDGVIKKAKVPKKHIARVQVVEYIRSFLLGRMAWSQLNGLMLISGAFALYPRNRLIEINGLETDTVGEDFELCVRLRRHMEDQDLPYKVVYIPETLCWTESPSTFSVFIKQRDRWARGLWEVLFKHKKILFNPRYGKMGMLWIPYWFLFDFGAPIVEFLGILLIIVYAILGLINWPVALLLFAFVYLVGCVFSTMAVYLYVRRYPHYNKISQVRSLLISAYLEPFLYHPTLVFAQLKGYFKKLFGIETGWGTMTRKGFGEETEEA